MSRTKPTANRRSQPASAGGAIAHLDRIGRQTVGWIVDQTTGSAPTNFVLKLDGVSITAHATVPRPDVVLAGLASDPLVGFAIDTSDLLLEWQAKNPRFASPKTLSLAIGGAVVLRRDLPDLSEVVGTLDVVGSHGISGSVSGEALRILDVDVEVLFDDVLFETVSADRVVAASEVPTKTFHLPITSSPGIERTFKVDARIVLSGRWLEGSSATLNTNVDDRLPVAVASALEGVANPNVSIIIPIFNAPAALDACLQSVRRETTRPANLILIDDGSTDPEIRKILRAIEQTANVTIRRHSKNLGYTATINEGIEIAGSDDVVLLNSDTIVPPRWLENLRFAAYSDHAIATVTPLSNNAGAFSAPLAEIENPLPERVSFSNVARAVLQESAVTLPEVPTASGFCMYIKRTCLDEAGLFDAASFPRGYGEENEFCMRLMRAGWRHVVDDRTYVFHQRSASFGVEQRATLSDAATATIESQYPEYRILIDAFSKGHELSVARYRTRRALARTSIAAPVKPRLLTVISSQSGGTPLTNRDLASGLSNDYDVYVLHSDRETLVLSLLVDGTPQLVATKVLTTPIRLAKHFTSAYDQALAELLVAYAIELVHVRHIAWHGLGLAAVCKQLEIPVVFSFHDFYTICPTVKLLDDASRFCGGACTPGKGHCRAELWEASEVPELKHSWVNVWREQTEAMLDGGDAFVTTSETTREIVCRNFPNLGERPFVVIPHGRDFNRFGRAAVVPRPGGKLRLLVPGNLSEAKGARILVELKQLDIDNLLEIHTAGKVTGLLERADMIHHGPFERNAFQDLADEVRPHLGLVLSIWPETFCHTLTELWASGIPVIGFDIGAVGERLRLHGGGIPVPTITAQSVYDTIRSVSGDKSAYHRLLAAVFGWQTEVATKQTIESMASSYRDLYQAVVKTRSPFFAE